MPPSDADAVKALDAVFVNPEMFAKVKSDSPFTQKGLSAKMKILLPDVSEPVGDDLNVMVKCEDVCPIMRLCMDIENSETPDRVV